jgi:2,3-bisphosphoglycerate-independent phosphoglycerate mutase
MKYVILLGDGMADYPVAALRGKTPLAVAHTPNMDKIATDGSLGLIETIPPGFQPGSDVANLTVLGYDPSRSYTGRGPLEAASLGIQLTDDDVAFRCNLVTLGSGPYPVMEDFTAGHISSEESRQIMIDLNAAIGSETFQFHPGVSYRHLVVWRKGEGSMKTVAPHDITGRAIEYFVPSGPGAGEIIALMEQGKKILSEHPVNNMRRSAGKRPANAIWLWGQGRAPRIIKLTDHYGIRGGVISAVDLLNGIGTYAGLEVIHVEGMTGYIDTNYRGKVLGALHALKDMDFVFLHVEAPDEMGHEGNLEGKIHAIEDFDRQVVGPVMDGLAYLGPFRIMVLSDHPTPLSIKTHAADPSPFAVLSSEVGENRTDGTAFSEEAARRTGLLFSPGYKLIAPFIRDWRSAIAKP